MRKIYELRTVRRCDDEFFSVHAKKKLSEIVIRKSSFVNLIFIINSSIQQ